MLDPTHSPLWQLDIYWLHNEHYWWPSKESKHLHFLLEWLNVECLMWNSTIWLGERKGCEVISLRVMQAIMGNTPHSFPIGIQSQRTQLAVSPVLPNYRPWTAMAEGLSWPHRFLPVIIQTHTKPPALHCVEYCNSAVSHFNSFTPGTKPAWSLKACMCMQVLSVWAFKYY